MAFQIDTCFLVTRKIPSALRKELLARVKSGEIAHLKSDGLKPEAFFVPKFIWMAQEQRVAHAEKMNEICKSVLA